MYSISELTELLSKKDDKDFYDYLALLYKKNNVSLHFISTISGKRYNEISKELVNRNVELNNHCSKKALTIEEQQNIINDYCINHCSIQNIIKKNHTSYKNVREVLNINNVSIRTKGGKDVIDRTCWIDLYKSGFTLQEISDKYGNIGLSIISNYLKNNGVKIHHDMSYWHNDINTDCFKEIVTEGEAYFLGLLITDGCILDNNQVTLSLQKEDAYILNEFNKITNNQNTIKFGKGRHSNMAEAHFKNYDIAKNLAQYGCVPRKTFIAHLPNIRHDLMRHMIRGLIDGDGSIQVYDNAQRVFFCGASPLVFELHRYLTRELTLNKTKVYVKQQKNPLYFCQWSSQKDINAICHYLYDGSDEKYRLKRKYEKYIQANTVVNYPQ